MNIKIVILLLKKIIKGFTLLLKSNLVFINYLKLSFYLQDVDLKKNGNDETVLIEVLWKNPNHLFRLWLILLALKKNKTINVIIIAWKEKFIVNCMMIWLKGANIIYIDTNVSHHNKLKAKKYLQKIKSYKHFMEMKLPDKFPSYIIFDTVLKKKRHPKPELSDPEWLVSFSEYLHLNEQIEKIIVQNKPNKVFVSHAWKTEFCLLIFNSIKRSIPVYHVTGFCESIRIKKIENLNDFHVPIDHLDYKTYLAQSNSTKNKLSKFGFKELKKRQLGQVNDINVSYAYKKNSYQNNYIKNNNNRKKVLVAAHAWFDFPHSFGMNNFTDFLDFIMITLGEAKKNKSVDWYFKPHPTEEWYGGFKLKDIMPNDKKNIFFVNTDGSSNNFLDSFDTVITVHGTIALEAAALNKTVICADRSYYSNWPFVFNPLSKNEYKNILKNIEILDAKRNDTSKLAAACLYGSIGSPEN